MNIMYKHKLNINKYSGNLKTFDLKVSKDFCRTEL